MTKYSQLPIALCFVLTKFSQPSLFLSFLQASELCLSSSLSKHKQKRGMCLPSQLFLGISLPQRDAFPISPHRSFSLLCLAFPPKFLLISLCLSLLYPIKKVFLCLILRHLHISEIRPFFLLQ